MQNRVAGCMVSAGVSLLFTLGCSGEASELANDGELDQSITSLARQKDSAGKELGPMTSKIASLNEHVQGLVARLAVTPDSMLEFYEFAPGSIALSGAGRSGPSGLREEDFEANDIGRIWDIYAKGAPRPRALNLALTRQQAENRGPSKLDAPAQSEGDDDASGGHRFVETDQRSPVTATAEGQLGKVQQAFVGGYCDTLYFTHNEPPWNEPMGNCVTNWDFAECLNPRFRSIS